MSANKLNFRLATPEDAPALERLINTAFNADTTTQVFLFADHAATVVTDTAGILAKIADPTCAVFVAADPANPSSDTLVAHCSTAKRADFAARGYAAWFGLLAVDAGCQGRGYGTQALAWAEGYARREWGARRMEFDVVGARVDLVAWYGRRGYEATGETSPFGYEHHKDWEGVLRDDLYFMCMGKDLNASG
jgi:GNAT superfamily N-acetyltransferase